MIHRLLFPIVAIALLCVSVRNSSAQSDDHVNSALPTAQAWLRQIDSGLYDESYAAGGSALHGKIAQDRWNLVLKTIRTAWGGVLSRKEVSHEYKPRGYEGSDGEFMVITYDTSFQKLDPAKEVIVLNWEGGRWRGAGYNAGAKPNPQDNQATPPPQPPTQTTTITTKQPVQ